MKYLLHSASGAVFGSGECPDGSDTSHLAVGAALLVVPDLPADVRGLFVIDGEVVALPAPSTFHKWTDSGWVLSEPAVRAHRSALLAACDWTQLPDVPTATREAWVPYRQRLRELPEQSGYPEVVNWPVPPT